MGRAPEARRGGYRARRSRANDGARSPPPRGRYSRPILCSGFAVPYKLASKPHKEHLRHMKLGLSFRDRKIDFVKNLLTDLPQMPQLRRNCLTSYAYKNTLRAKIMRLFLTLAGAAVLALPVVASAPAGAATAHNSQAGAYGGSSNSSDSTVSSRHVKHAAKHASLAQPAETDRDAGMYIVKPHAEPEYTSHAAGSDGAMPQD